MLDVMRRHHIYNEDIYNKYIKDLEETLMDEQAEVDEIKEI